MAGEKPRVICPYCQRDGTVLANGQPAHFTINGMTAHVRAHHPNDYKDWQANKASYATSNACNASGQLLKGGSPAGDTFPEEPEPEPSEPDDEYIIEELDGEEPNEPEPEPEPKPKPKPKQRSKPKPKSEPEPSEPDDEYIIEELDGEEPNEPEPEPEPKPKPKPKQRSKPKPKSEPEPEPEPEPAPDFAYNPYGFKDE